MIIALKDNNFVSEEMRELDFLGKYILSLKEIDITNTREFDPGSGRTLAACLTHASRAGSF